MENPTLIIEKYSKEYDKVYSKIDDQRFILRLNSRELIIQLLLQFDTGFVNFASAVFKLPNLANDKLNKLLETLLIINSTLSSFKIGLQEDTVFLTSSIPNEAFNEDSLDKQISLYLNFYDETYPQLLRVMNELELNAADEVMFDTETSST